ncbi:MAG: hypothetical protein R6T92_11815 [Desulfosalsimonadaceae bacterium]
MEQMVSAMGVPPKFQVNQTIHITENRSGSGDDRESAEPLVYRQSMRYRMPGIFRADISSQDMRHVYISIPGEALTVIDEGIVSQSENPFYSYGILFSYGRRAELTDRLKELGIDVHVSSLGRLDKTICYVIGARYPDADVPQLWVDRENFMPVRLVPSAADNDDETPAQEIRFSQWRRFNGIRYPGEIVFLEEGAVVQEIVVDSIDANPVFEPGIFDIQKLTSSLKDKGDEDKTDGDKDISDEIQQEIDQFKRIFE